MKHARVDKLVRKFRAIKNLSTRRERESDGGTETRDSCNEAWRQGVYSSGPLGSAI